MRVCAAFGRGLAERRLPVVNWRRWATRIPSEEEVVGRLASGRPCPIVIHELVVPRAEGGELPGGGRLVLSNAEIAAHLLEFAGGTRSPETLITSGMRPKRVGVADRFKTR